MGLVASTLTIRIPRLRLGRWPDSLVAYQVQRPKQSHKSALVWHIIDYNRDCRCNINKSDTALSVSLSTLSPMSQP